MIGVHWASVVYLKPPLSRAICLVEVLLSLFFSLFRQHGNRYAVHLLEKRFLHELLDVL